MKQPNLSALRTAKVTNAVMMWQHHTLARHGLSIDQHMSFGDFRPSQRQFDIIHIDNAAQVPWCHRSLCLPSQFKGMGGMDAEHQKGAR